MVLLRFLFAVLLLPLCACSITPAAGPTAREIEFGSGVIGNGDYLVIDLDHSVVASLAGVHSVGLSQAFPKKYAVSPDRRIGIGDTLAITIWEAGDGGLFSTGSSRNAEFPQVLVDQRGRISLPYAGIMQVLDKTPMEVQQAIVKSISDRAIQPQVVVSIAKNESNTVVVSGDVVNPGRYPLSLNGDRLLDVLAAAGGAKFPARETYVTFIRGPKRGSQLLEAVVENQDENIYISPGDRIYLSHEPKKYTVFGAVAKPGVYAFDSPQVNLLEAIAAAGGPLDSRADATGLFLFRYETRDVVWMLRPGYESSKYSTHVPVVYRVSLRDPLSYFLARGFLLKDKDVLYAANAEGVEIAKVLKLIALGTASLRGGLRIAPD
jgi:polysaccharide export outer membrane protein